METPKIIFVTSCIWQQIGLCVKAGRAMVVRSIPMMLQGDFRMTIQPIQAGFKVDPFRGASDSSVSMQWFTRPADEKYLTLTDMLAVARHRWDHSVQLRVDTRGFD